MGRWHVPLILAGLTLVVVLSGCDALGQSPAATPGATHPTATAAPPATKPTLVTVAGQDIVVLEPQPRQVVSSPLRIAGYARVYEGTVLFEVTDAKGGVVAKGFTAASSAAPALGYFSTDVAFSPLAQDETGTLRVFGQDPREGQRLHLVEVPVTLAGITRASTATSVRPGAATATPGRTLDLKLYFTTTTNNNAQLVPVQRSVPYTPQMGRASLDLLLAGPTAEEKSKGLNTAIPAGAKVKNLRIENGVAYADFDEKLQEGAGGSLRVASIRQQITLTLKQFSTVREVVISINGRTEDILQP